MCRKLNYLVPFVLLLSMAVNTSADLVVHWGFDEGSGTVVHDTSGNGHDGTINGTPQWVPGIAGGAMHFDGSTYVDVADDIGEFETFSIALWFKYDSFIADWNSIWHNNDWTSGWLHHMVTNYSGQDIRVQFAINGAGDQFGTTPIETDVWYHSTVTYDSTTGEMNFYLTTDEEKQANLDVALTVSGPATIITAGQIGGWEGGRLSSATFDDIRMYDHILSEVEILGAMAGKIWP
ncbi:MAG: LamG-like jellyroll fold domain-containing protein, partial [Planctomycetota bacterium]